MAFIDSFNLRYEDFDDIEEEFMVGSINWLNISKRGDLTPKFIKKYKYIF